MASPLSGELLRLPIHELRGGYLSDVYFWREKRALEEHGIRSRVTMQVFQKQDAILCGIDESLAVLKAATGRYRDYDRAAALLREYLRSRQPEISDELESLWEDGFGEFQIDSLSDGDRISPWESVMHIAGDAALFAHLETIYLGILSRRTRIATNVRRVVEAANGKTVLFFPARHDIWSAQAGDGYAAHIGGADSVSTDAQGAWWGASGMGTIPHALIAAVGGDTAKAASIFHETYPGVKLVALVDFDNDCVGTSLACARALGPDLWGVRLDTSETIVDKSVQAIQCAVAKAGGVVPELVFLTREALDREGFQHVRIVVSGGFTAEKITAFESRAAPVDAYGVGSSLLKGSTDFTADVVLVDGKPGAKVGREFRPNPRMRRVEMGD